MKSILIATDFSPASRAASQYGIMLAKAFRTNAVLFHAWRDVPEPILDTLFVYKPEDLAGKIKQELENEADLLTEADAVPIELDSRQSPTVQGILAAAHEAGAGLIIAGAKGEGKKTRRLLGSTVVSLARKTDIPLLIIPENNGKVRFPPKKIALANDLSPDTDMKTLDIFRQLMIQYHPVCYIIRIVTKKWMEGPEIANRPARLQELLHTTQSPEPIYEYRLDNDIPRSLLEIITSQQIDMLAISPHHHSLLEKVFNRSTTKEMVFESTIPLLILPMPQK